MRTVTSNDGTTIAYDRLGDGPTTVILVHGGMVTRGDNARLAELLADRFTVLNYDRRGRGDSGDTPGSLRHEIEDLAALFAAAGGPAALFGLSSGGALVLEAAASGLPVSRLAVYEIPYFNEPEMRERGRQYAAGLTEAIAGGRRDDAVDLFLGLVGMPAEMIAGMHHAPQWPGMTAIAHTLVYDAEAVGYAGRGGPTPEERLASITVPALVLAGGASQPWMLESAQLTAKALPNSEHAVLDGQTHDVDMAVLAPVLATFFS